MSKMDSKVFQMEQVAAALEFTNQMTEREKLLNELESLADEMGVLYEDDQRRARIFQWVFAVLAIVSGVMVAASLALLLSL